MAGSGAGALDQTQVFSADEVRVYAASLAVRVYLLVTVSVCVSALVAYYVFEKGWFIYYFYERGRPSILKLNAVMVLAVSLAILIKFFHHKLNLAVCIVCYAVMTLSLGTAMSLFLSLLSLDILVSVFGVSVLVFLSASLYGYFAEESPLPSFREALALVCPTFLFSAYCAYIGFGGIGSMVAVLASFALTLRYVAYCSWMIHEVADQLIGLGDASLEWRGIMAVASELVMLFWTVFMEIVEFVWRGRRLI